MANLRSSGEGSSHEDPDIMEISPSRYQKQKRKRIHQVVSRDVVEIDEDNDLDAVEIISTRNSDYKKQSVGYYEASHRSIKEALPYTIRGISAYFASKNQIILSNSEPIPKRLCKNERGMIVEDEIDMRFKSFKQFDIVQDHSDHAFCRPDIMACNLSGKEREILPPTKNLIKRIHYEWKILKEALPETIYVRAYEGRMDLLSAVIIGAAGTPYHDGLFFFDIYFHPKYPNSAPYVKYHNIGLNLNPQFGSAGNVCVSLLSHFGSGCEAWCPSKSTILQNFEDLISGHFRKHGRAFLTACLAYLDGAQVGCVDEDGIQDVNKVDSSSSSDFRILLGCMICDMMREFTAKGADCNDLMQKVNAISAAAATRAKKPNQYLDSHYIEEGNLIGAIHDDTHV